MRGRRGGPDCFLLNAWWVCSEVFGDGLIYVVLSREGMVGCVLGRKGGGLEIRGERVWGRGNWKGCGVGGEGKRLERK